MYASLNSTLGRTVAPHARGAWTMWGDWLWVWERELDSLKSGMVSLWGHGAASGGGGSRLRERGKKGTGRRVRGGESRNATDEGYEEGRGRRGRGRGVSESGHVRRRGLSEGGVSRSEEPRDGVGRASVERDADVEAGKVGRRTGVCSTRERLDDEARSDRRRLGCHVSPKLSCEGSSVTGTLSMRRIWKCASRVPPSSVGVTAPLPVLGLEQASGEGERCGLG